MSKKNSKSAAKKVEKAAKKHPKLIVALCVIVAIIVLAAVVLYFVKPDIYHKYLGVGDHTWGEWNIKTEETCGKKGTALRICTVCDEEEWDFIPATGEHSYDSDEICTVCNYDKNFNGTAADVGQSEFSIHIIDLGEYAGDSIYIKAGDNDILIDAGSRAGSASLICEYLSEYVTDNKLEYVIATHADQDHIAAFVGSGENSGVLYKYEVDTLIKFDNITKKKENSPTKVYTDFMSAVDYLKANGTTVYTAGQCYNETDGAKRQYWLDSEHTLSMNILYNHYYYNQSTDENNHSVVTLFTKTTDTGNFNYLFTGDLEKDGESRMVDYYAKPSNSKSEYDILPEVDFYKAGHHGSGTSSTAKLLDAIKPKYIAISCCAGSPEYTKNNLNTFPYQASLDNMLKHTEKIYCTGMAKNLPKLNNNGEFASKKYDYEPHNGNIVFFFNSRINAAGETTGNIKLWCSNSYDTLIETEWFQKYRTYSKE